MKLELRKGDSLEEINLVNQKLTALLHKKGVDTDKYLGKLKLNKDALTSQRGRL